MQLYTPPFSYIKNRFTIFLGGTIELGKSEDWQAKMIRDLESEDIIILNPRRPDFDATQEQKIENPYFNGQVTWELEGLECSDLIIMNLLPGTYSPITLMEIGLFTNISLKENKNMIICCPEGFWRKGNVDIVSNRYGIELVTDYFSLISRVREKIRLEN